MSNRSTLRVLTTAVIALLGASWLPARAQCDTSPPALAGFSFNPSSINTTLSSQTVTCTMTLTDALSGVASATCAFTAPDFFHRASCSASLPTSGTPQNGVWSCTMTVPRYSPSGTWTASVSATDYVGNTAQLNPALGGFPTSLTVTSDPDTVAPALTNFTLMPTTVNVSAASQNVTCNMTLTDAKSGVVASICQLAAPDSDQVAACSATSPSSGTPANGTWSCTLTIPRYADAGTWIPFGFAIDAAGNVPQPPYMPAAMLAVTSSPEDITAPSTSFSFAPPSISTGASPKLVTCTMVVADSPAGVNSATCTFSLTTFVPPDFVQQSHSCTATAPSSGTRNSGTFQCNVLFPRYAAGGAWTSSVSLTDLPGNTADLPQAATLTVDCATAELETTCRFATDHQTLSWSAVAGATQYNVYRGPFTNFVDTNADHLPDGGYGTCQNSRDGNIADTVFVDTDVPSAGQGLFYLVAYKAGGVQRGLGFNSFGTARTVATACP